MKYLKFLSLLLLVSCKPMGKPQASLFLYNQEDLFINSFGREIELLGSDRFDLQSFDSHNSQLIQNEQIEDAEDQDILIVNPVDRLGAHALIRNAKKSDQAIVFFNREPLAKDLELWENAYYVGARAEQSGEMQAKMIIELFGGDPRNLNKHDKNGDGIIQCIILKGEQGHQDAEIRTSKLIKSFEDKGFALEILKTEVANWDRGEAYEKMSELNELYGDQMEVIFSNNDAMALGAISLLMDKSYFDDSNGNGQMDSRDEAWLPIVGIDGLDAALDMIQQGYLYGSVYNDYKTMAHAIVILSHTIVNDLAIDQMAYTVEDDHYIWVNYKVLIR